jgi:sulfur transfer complex TusBCD TusB component (DsrH family)
MPEWDARSQKIPLGTERYKKQLAKYGKRYLWCLPLPFLLRLDVGYGLYTLGLAYYGVVVEKPGLRGASMLSALLGLLWMTDAAVRWKYGTALLLMTVLRWILEARHPTISRLSKAGLDAGLLAVSVLLLSISQILMTYSLAGLFLEGGLLVGFEAIYAYSVCLHPAQGKAADSPTEGIAEKNRRTIVASLALGSFLAAGGELTIGSLVLSEALLGYWALCTSKRDGAAVALLGTIPAAAVLRLTATGSEGLLLWTILLIVVSEPFRSMPKWQMGLSVGCSSLLYFLLFMPTSLGAGILTTAVSLTAFFLWPPEASCILPTRRPVGMETENELRRERSVLRQELEERRTAFSALAKLIPNSSGRGCLSERVDADRTSRIRPEEIDRLNIIWQHRMSQSRRLVRGQYELMAACLARMQDRMLGEGTEPGRCRQISQGKRKRIRIGIDSYGLCRKVREVCGDSYRLEPLGEDRYLMALSDGMGTGEAAGEESGRALQMLEQLLRTDLSEREALEMLHASMVLCAEGENFATLDIALIDRTCGRLRLIKAGAAVTYLCCRGTVKICRSTSLPVGLLEEEAAPEIYEYFLEPGDRIVMISDGVVDQMEDPRRGEEWIRHYLLHTTDRSARQMAEEIQQGLRLTSERSPIEDDQTILTARIWG